MKEISQEEWKQVQTSPKVKRTYREWFSLPMVLGRCSNENCADPRDKLLVFVWEYRGNFMCRYCFLSGWLDE